MTKIPASNLHKACEKVATGFGLSVFPGEYRMLSNLQLAGHGFGKKRLTINEILNQIYETPAPYVTTRNLPRCV